MTKCERGTQRKSERLIEHLASIALLRMILVWSAISNRIRFFSPRGYGDVSDDQ